MRYVHGAKKALGARLALAWQGTETVAMFGDLEELYRLGRGSQIGPSVRRNIDHARKRDQHYETSQFTKEFRRMIEMYLEKGNVDYANVIRECMQELG